MMATNVFQLLTTLTKLYALEITDAIQWLVDQGHTVKPHLVTGYWKDKQACPV